MCTSVIHFMFVTHSCMAASVSSKYFLVVYMGAIFDVNGAALASWGTQYN